MLLKAPAPADLDADLTIDDLEAVGLFQRLAAARRRADHQSVRDLVHQLRAMGWACYALERARGDP